LKTSINNRGLVLLRRGFTLVELMVAIAIGMVVLGSTMILLLESAKEQKRGLADATVEQAAADLESRLIGYLRVMSAREGIIFSVPAKDTGGNVIGYSSIIGAQGPAPDYPRQQITFDANTGKVLFYANRTLTNAATMIIKNQRNLAVRQACFSPSLKLDGTTDNSLINVLLRLDDNGASGRTLSPNPASVWRTFSVRMRNT